LLAITRSRKRTSSKPSNQDSNLLSFYKQDDRVQVLTGDLEKLRSFYMDRVTQTGPESRVAIAQTTFSSP
jgi:hypothetical protein